MPRIRILQPIGGVDFSWRPGQIVDVPEKQATTWADGVRAELVADEPPAKPERAARRSRGGGRSPKAETPERRG
ncbi:hypothetical protein [Streptomyces sp. NPDC088923]|uniref:hypothetical protein n=1 Tax=Streptomyces sp. NPDC088923 TaxID=3365913 RepID=UPI00380B7295